MRHLVCACICVPYVNLLYTHVCLIYHQHWHPGCWYLLQLVFVVVDVRSFASTSITLHCEVLGVCQERKGNTSMAFIPSSSLFFLSLYLICCLVCIEPIQWLVSKVTNTTILLLLNKDISTLLVMIVGRSLTLPLPLSLLDCPFNFPLRLVHRLLSSVRSELN
jgi:hypothetical protein